MYFVGQVRKEKLGDSPKAVNTTALSTKDSKRTSRLVLIIVAILLAVLVGAILLTVRNKNRETSQHVRDYIIRVNGREYSKSELQFYVQPQKEIGEISEEDAIDNVYSVLMNIEIAKALDIEPSEEAVSLEVGSTPNFDKQNGLVQGWLKLSAKSNIIERTLADYKTNGINPQGYSYIFRFGENIEWGPSYKAPGFGDQQLIDRDREYAKSKADEYHKKLVDKAITPDKALEEIKADPQLGYFYKANTNKSARFGMTPGSLERDIFYSDLRTAILDQKSAGVSSVQAGRTAVIPEPQGDSDYAETYYYFLLVDKPHTSSTDFTIRLDEATSKIHQASGKEEG